MVKFGKQLELGIYEPWRSYYISYARLKRVIDRIVFLREESLGLRSNASFARHPSISELDKEYSQSPFSSPLSSKRKAIEVPSAYVPRDPLDDRYFTSLPLFLYSTVITIEIIVTLTIPSPSLLFKHILLDLSLLLHLSLYIIDAVANMME